MTLTAPVPGGAPPSSGDKRRRTAIVLVLVAGLVVATGVVVRVDTRTRSNGPLGRSDTPGFTGTSGPTDMQGRSNFTAWLTTESSPLRADLVLDSVSLRGAVNESVAFVLVTLAPGSKTGGSFGSLGWVPKAQDNVFPQRSTYQNLSGPVTLRKGTDYAVEANLQATNLRAISTSRFVDLRYRVNGKKYRYSFEVRTCRAAPSLGSALVLCRSFSG